MSAAKHGVVLDGADVCRILECVERLRDRANDLPPSVGYYAKQIAKVINGATYSCHKCPDNCMEQLRPVDPDHCCQRCGHADEEGDRVLWFDEGDPPGGYECENDEFCRRRCELQAGEGFCP